MTLSKLAENLEKTLDSLFRITEYLNDFMARDKATVNESLREVIRTELAPTQLQLNTTVERVLHMSRGVVATQSRFNETVRGMQQKLDNRTELGVYERLAKLEETTHEIALNQRVLLQELRELHRRSVGV